LTRSINDTIDELEIRQETQARSSRLIALGTMLSGVAHELNNPLSNISSSCQILQEEWNELPAQSVSQLLEQIDHQVLRAERIVSALLDFSGNHVLRRRRENVRSLVEEALQHVQFQIRRAVPVRISIDGNQEIDVDRMRFQQVLVNIIKNAAEAIGSDGTVFIRAKRVESIEGWRSILEIEDDGPGIPVEYLTRVFDPFYTTKEVGKGTGLGLSVAHEIVTQHGGLLTASSGQKSGTCFHIEIPDVATEVKNSD
jgi:signal transduction histidine kinase